jgi:DNA polymerase (family X)
MNLSNGDVAKLLRSVAAAYTIKKLGNIFQIRAYETAADAIEHSTSEVQDLWEEEKLDQIPGVGKAIQAYLEELFKKGQVSHFETVKKGIPHQAFEFLDIPGIGPKTAIELANLGVKNTQDLQLQIKTGKLAEKGFSPKIAQKIMDGIREVSSREGRMLLPVASAYAEKILEFIKSIPGVVEANPLGSLRRKVATIGDLDFAASAKDPKAVVNAFVKMKQVSRIVDQGEAKAVVILKSGLHVDLLVGEPANYGALLQHFTGSKHHNIKLRTYAEKHGYSLSEYGVKNIKTGKIIPIRYEKELYAVLKMDTPEPEMREDNGEIEAALAHKLPNLVQSNDIKGDLHLHSNFPINHPSHGPGADPIENIVKRAIEIGYDYVGVSDHPPGHNSNTKEEIIKWVAARTKFIQSIKKNTKSVRVLNSLEIDILGDGSLSVPDEALATLDYCIAGIHHGHRGTKEVVTRRLISALENPHVDIISHPSNRLLNERDSSDIDWEEVFKVAAKNNKILEIDAFPNRLDLRDDLVRMAKEYGVKFVIDTDAHAVEQMDNMEFGVSVAKRGWATKEDIVNTWQWKDLVKWFNIKE